MLSKDETLLNINSPGMAQKLKAVLSQRTKVRYLDDSRRPSAILAPIYYQEGQYHIIFTRRTELVHHHKGEISFPGGGYHPDDKNLLTTALRESSEEIGLAPQDVEVLGELDDTPTRGSPYIITPFVGFILPDYQFKTNGFEIAELIRIPISALMEKGCRRDESPVMLGDRLVIPSVYTYQDKRIIGATARILLQFLDLYVQAASLS
jgi:8-oxo-dGTP pyrophosphatase MutT (NUDIX family)